MVVVIHLGNCEFIITHSCSQRIQTEIVDFKNFKNDVHRSEKGRQWTK